MMNTAEFEKGRWARRNGSARIAPRGIAQLAQAEWNRGWDYEDGIQSNAAEQRRKNDDEEARRRRSNDDNSSSSLLTGVVIGSMLSDSSPTIDSSPSIDAGSFGDGGSFGGGGADTSW